MEHPNNFIGSFSGVIDLGSDYGREAIQINNVLLRGTVLRSTEWIIGVVVNTGHDTKVMMSNTKTKPKTSSLEQSASNEIKRIILLLILVCAISATGNAIFDSSQNVNHSWYLNIPVSLWIKMFFYYLLLHATFIPVSLYVSMSLVRSFQSYFMNNDLEMYYERTDTPAFVRTMTLNEELGMYVYICICMSTYMYIYILYIYILYIYT
jgi:phospholipid-translocating ATPase/phospholipid-transporting ATPase